MSGKTFYTLDRAGTLVEDARIDYQDTFSPIVELKEHIESRFWQKVSRHGNNYFFNYNINLLSSNENLSVFMEMLLEERRRASFPDRPSRFRSLFACETVREAAWFRGSSKANLSTAIYEVHSELVCHRADMKLLNVNCTPPEMSHRLDLYWQGKTKELYPGYEPFWEVLVPLPAIIGRRIQE
ncbi:hypothetical protein CFG14_22540 [Salmonella enterica]|nr:hypothetical protein [Salmonella enterica]EDR7078350.1 hypothetical protein [Salmonella enterica subsp. enterica serovar Gatuni]EDT0686939.1 hypothetical protein [Salmonella enterica subsp. enterica serovar Kokomlemle]EDU5440772.1 hypothetical protein [Salmonella enterica subsp. enterica serovar Hadar]EEE1373651.1 hypothetical protein [Salmonella enterica subsp. enterica serovar Durban]